MNKKIKKMLGFKKGRTRAEVDADYQREALLLGHKSRTKAQIEQSVAGLEREIAEHLENLLQLNSEGMKLPALPAETAEGQKP